MDLRRAAEESDKSMSHIVAESLRSETSRSQAENGCHQLALLQGAPDHPLSDLFAHRRRSL